MNDNTHDSTHYVRLTLAERLQIEQMLREGRSIRYIAAMLHRHQSTIQHEIGSYSSLCDKGAVGRRGRNRCQKRGECEKRASLCEDCPRSRDWHCKSCWKCNSVCPDFVEATCPKRQKSPYVCNGCADERKCSLSKILYLATEADKAARELRKEARRGANVSDEELRRIERILAPGVQKGQSINHILCTNADKFTVSVKTIYRYIDAGIISVRNGDLPRKIYLKPRRRKRELVHKVDRKCRIGRTLEDYDLFCEAEGPFPRILMDTVIGRPGGKVILTIHFCESNFMIARLLPNKTSASVIEAFNQLSDMLGYEVFRGLFPIILTDNGSEFSNPERLEHFPDATPRTHLFYCDAFNSNQKAEIERNHEFLRLILPKGTTFDNLQQSDLDLILSHINSYTRPKLGNKTPIDLFTHRYSPEILDRLNQTPIAPDQICLKPDLLKRS